MRNTHLLQVALKPKTQGAKEETVYLMRHLIEAIIPNPEGSTILMNSGVTYEVVDKAEAIIRKAKDAGLLVVL